MYTSGNGFEPVTHYPPLLSFALAVVGATDVNTAATFQALLFAGSVLGLGALLMQRSRWGGRSRGAAYLYDLAAGAAGVWHALV